MKKIMLIPNVKEGVSCQQLQDSLTRAGYDSGIELIDDSLLGSVQAIVFSVKRLSYILEAVQFIDKKYEADIAIKIVK